MVQDESVQENADTEGQVQVQVRDVSKVQEQEPMEVDEEDDGAKKVEVTQEDPKAEQVNIKALSCSF